MRPPLQFFKKRLPFRKVTCVPIVLFVGQILIRTNQFPKIFFLFVTIFVKNYPDRLPFSYIVVGMCVGLCVNKETRKKRSLFIQEGVNQGPHLGV